MPSLGCEARGGSLMAPLHPPQSACTPPGMEVGGLGAHLACGRPRRPDSSEKVALGSSGQGQMQSRPREAGLMESSHLDALAVYGPGWTPPSQDHPSPYPAPPPAHMMARPAPLAAADSPSFLVCFLRIQILYRFVCGTQC